ncbi:MAG TPA: MazG family protein [Micromonosporaceae bacterium]|jgi:XTP/dITP diphosphohydrolase
MPARIVLLVTSPRLPAGLLTAEAWDLLRAHPVLTTTESPQSVALARAGVNVTFTATGVADVIAAATEAGTAIWLGEPGGDERFARELGLRLARQPGLAELELAYGSWDPPGARLLDAVTVMDRLSVDPWKRQQTHRSLAKYMLEEAYEAVDAIEADDFVALREELGDVLLQVILHARMAEDRPPGQAWSIDDVAGGLVDKLIRRNPHIFADADAETVDEITAQWERIKKAEKAGQGPMDSIALGQPALSLATKVQERAARAGIPMPPPEPDTVGGRLWALVAEAVAAGSDAEAELRRVALQHIANAT